MKAYLSRRYHFSASHRLYSETYDDAQNREIFGKCSNPHGHGHNYTVQVTLSGKVQSQKQKTRAEHVARKVKASSPSTTNL